MESAIIIAIIGGIGSVAASVGVPLLLARAARKRAAAELADARSRPPIPTPPTTDGMWKRLDEQDEIIRALVGMMAQVADQWQGDHPPKISQRYIDVLAQKNYLPADWSPAQ